MSTKSRVFRPFERHQAFVVSLVLSFIIIFGLACIVAYKSYTNAIEATIRSNETRATLLAKLILEHQRATIGVLQSYAERPLLVDSVKKKDFEGTLKHLIDLAKHNPEMDWPFIANSDSTVWVNYPVDKQTMGKDLSYRDWYKGVRKEWKPYVSSVYKLLVGEKDLAVAVAVPIFDEKGKTIGILCTAQSTSFFQKIIGEVGLNLDAKMTLIGQEGHIIYSNRFPYSKEIIVYPSLEFVKSAMKGERGNVKVRDASDRERMNYVSFAPIEGIGWSIIVEKARSEVLRSEYLYLVLIGVISLLIYGVVVLSLIYLRERHRQINQLEILNEGLDSRVRERTSELEARNEALREGEERYRNLVRYAPAGIYEIDFTTGRFTDVNDVMCQILGYSRDELLSMTAFNILDDEGRTRFASRIRLAQSGQKPEQATEYLVRAKDGRLIWALLNITFRWRGDKIVGAEVVANDITDRKKAEQQVLDREDELRLVMNTVPALLSYIDPRFHYRRVNQGYERWFGLAAGELEGRHVREVLGEDAWELVRSRLEQAMAGETITYEEQMPYTTGTRWVSTTLVPDFELAGKVRGLVALVTDITERKRAEEELRRSEEVSRAILNATMESVFLIDLAGTVLTSNAVGAERLGRRVEEIIGQNLFDLVPEDVANRRRPYAEQVIRAGKAIRFEDERSGKWIDASVCPVFDPAGNVSQLAIFARDITQRKRAEEALHQRTLELQHLADTLEQRVKDRTADVEKERRRLYDVLETMPAMICLLTPDYHVAFTNRAFREKFGEPQGRHCYDYCFGKTEPCEFCESYSVFKTGQAHRWEVTGPDGTIFDAHDFPFTDVDGSPMILEMDLDITERKRAEEALKVRTAELADLSSQLVTAQENERRRVSYDLHDNVWQTLLAIRFEIENLFYTQAKDKWTALQHKSKEVMSNILKAVGTIRSMQGDLWPYVLDDIGIVATIDWFCREFEKNHSGIIIETKSDTTEDDIPSAAKVVIYRILQEALSNIAKHSRASLATVYLKNGDHTIAFTVQDNGIGFDPEEMIAKKAPLGGLGLLNIKARTELSGGIFDIESVQGKGTTIRATWAL